MSHNNPWFLITAEEIARIEKELHDIRHYVPEQRQAHISGALSVLNEVQVRRP